MEQNAYQERARKKIILTIVSVSIIGGLIVVSDQLKAPSSASTNTVIPSPLASSTLNPASSPISTNNTTTSSSSQSASNYKDGTFSASSSYIVPHGNESIQVSVSLQNGVITNASVQNSEGDRESAQYQEEFAAEYKSYVIGKKLDGLNLDVVSGASDTTQGFNDALSKIAAKAQA